MKKLLLFTVTFILFFYWLVPVIFPFKSAIFDPYTIAWAYVGWYAMIFSLTLLWFDTVKRNGCWFFSK